jgi:hypothetical protein
MSASRPAAAHAVLLAALLVATIMRTGLAAASGNERSGDGKAAAGAEEVAVTVSPHLLFEGGSVLGRIRLEPDPQNRAMHVEVDGGDYFSSSTVQLEGAAAPLVWERRWKGLPAGTYRVRVTVEHAQGDPHTCSSEFTVIDPRAEGPR